MPPFKNYFFKKKNFEKKKKNGDPKKKKKRVGVAQKDLAQRTWHKGPGTKGNRAPKSRHMCVPDPFVPDPFVPGPLCQGPFVPGPLCQVLCARCSCATLTISFFIQCHRPKNYFFQKFF
jgi:hypothetical protein